MRRLLFFCAAALTAAMFSSCLSAKNADKASQTYNWDEYSSVTYAYVKNKDDDSRAKMMEVYEKVINGQQDTLAQTVPPGVYADYGYMLVDEGKEEEGLVYLRLERDLYPMSAPFLDKIIERIEDNNPGGTYDDEEE